MTVWLSLLVLSACYGLDILPDQTETKAVANIGCPLPEEFRPAVCTDGEGESKALVTRTDSTIPTDVMCILVTDTTITHVICTPLGELLPVNDESLTSRMKRQAFTATGAAIGSMFGPVGTLIGAGIGLIGDILCIFICRDNGPPPNRPPSIGQAILNVSTPIITPPNKTSAVVTWTDPEVSDPEDKILAVITYPNGSNGQEFGEGFHYVSFSVKDSGGLTAYSGLSFEIRVLRCPQPRWKDNGRFKCSSSTFISGSICSLECNKGYVVDKSDENMITCTQNGQVSNWEPADLPSCTPKECEAIPAIANGYISCPHGEGFFGEVCGTICEDGYVLKGSTGLFMCDEHGTWPNNLPHCHDSQPPTFKTCPDNRIVNIDSKNNTASVSWDLPTGEDNSGESVIIEEQHGHKAGDQFSAGFHTIRYTIRDSNGNTGNMCSFMVIVSTIECEEPDFGNHMTYNCPDLYRIGAECKVMCKSGYPNIGVEAIQCANPSNSQPPKLQWIWDNNGLKPSCKETNCTDLKAPENGALACSLWDYGRFCQMQCQIGFDVPYSVELFVCGTSNGMWSDGGNVPDCIEKRNANVMNLRSDLYYYTGECNISAQNLNQIQNNFIMVLNASDFRAACVSVPECQYKFVEVTCGPIAGRRRRDVPLHFRDRRSSAPFAYMITFDLTVPFNVTPGKSALDVKIINDNILYSMTDIIQAEVDAGSFDLHISDLHTDSSSLGVGVPQLTCPHGSRGNAQTGTCIGCPTGRYMSLETSNCQYCPVGTYQDTPASTECYKCPPNTNTTTLGAKSINQCSDYCKAGSFSSSGLTPCKNCPEKTYQPEVFKTGCLSCQTGSRAAVTGSTSDKNCSVYDIVTDRGSALEVNNNYTSGTFTFLTWLKLRSTNDSQTIFQISSNYTSFSLAAAYEDVIKIETDGVLVDTGVKLDLNKWYHLGLNANSVTKKLSLYINGKSVYHNPTLLLSRTNLLEPRDLLHIDGDLNMASILLALRFYTDSEISTAASSCQAGYAGAVYTIDDFAESSTAQIQFAIPSRCDAVDDCESLPCGRFHCTDKMDDYECVCTENFTGKNCEIPPDFCQNNGCLNNAMCQTETTNYTCECPYGYSGRFCEKTAVDGEWSEWGAWAICSVSCGGAQTMRIRTCDSPLPDPEGKPCEGNDKESQSCNPEQCPECAVLRRSYGVMISCSGTGDYTRCTVSCNTNLYFATPPLTFYECGKITNFVWNHVTIDNPNGRLPVCTTVKPPSKMSLSLEGNYNTVPCTPYNSEVMVQQLESKFNTLDCVANMSCHAKAFASVCGNLPFRKKRASEEGLNVTLILETTVDSSLTGMTMDQLTANNTGNITYLERIVQQVMHLEKTAQEISKDSQTFFQMTIDGQPHTIATATDTSGLIVRTEAVCPLGSIRLDAFCAECPAGSYTDGFRVIMCPKGQYQDQTGQSSCQQCPTGFTTVGVGSEHLDECSEEMTMTQEIAKKKTDDDVPTANTVGIVVGSVVSILFLVLCGVLGTLVWKRFARKKRQVGNSFVDLNGLRVYHQGPSKTFFTKTPL